MQNPYKFHPLVYKNLSRNNIVAAVVFSVGTEGSDVHDFYDADLETKVAEFIAHAYAVIPEEFVEPSVAPSIAAWRVHNKSLAEHFVKTVRSPELADLIEARLIVLLESGIVRLCFQGRTAENDYQEEIRPDGLATRAHINPPFQIGTTMQYRSGFFFDIPTKIERIEMIDRDQEELTRLLGGLDKFLTYIADTFNSVARMAYGEYRNILQANGATATEIAKVNTPRFAESQVNDLIQNFGVYARDILRERINEKMEEGSTVLSHQLALETRMNKTHRETRYPDLSLTYELVEIKIVRYKDGTDDRITKVHMSTVPEVADPASVVQIPSPLQMTATAVPAK